MFPARLDAYDARVIIRQQFPKMTECDAQWALRELEQVARAATAKKRRELAIIYK